MSGNRGQQKNPSASLTCCVPSSLDKYSMSMRGTGCDACRLESFIGLDAIATLNFDSYKIRILRVSHSQNSQHIRITYLHFLQKLQCIFVTAPSSV